MAASAGGRLAMGTMAVPIRIRLVRTAMPASGEMPSGPPDSEDHASS